MGEVNTRVFDEVKKTVEETLKLLGHNVEDAKERIDAFMIDIEQDLTAALESGDTLSLELLRDQIYGHLARISLQTINKERQAVWAAVMTAIRILVTVV